MSGQGAPPRRISLNESGPRPGLASSQSNASSNVISSTTTLSPNRMPSRQHSSQQHIKIKDHLARPHLAGNHRTLSDALRAERSREEQETLNDDNETDVGDRDAGARESDPLLENPNGTEGTDEHADLDVYYNIHRIRRLILACIEDPYSMHQLKEPRMNVLIVKPLVDRLYDEDDVSIGEFMCFARALA